MQPICLRPVPDLAGGAHSLTRLPGGARVIVAPMRERASVSVAMMFGVGSRCEDAARCGIAHFIEHMFFKGAQRHPTAQAVSEAIEGVGGSVNAATDKEITVYWAKVPAEHLALAVDVLSDMVFASRFEPAEIAKERRVVVEELRMYLDNPQDHVHSLYDEVMWPDHPLGWDTAGTESTVMSFERDDCLRFLGEQYHEDTLVVSVAGAVEPGQVLEMVAPAVGSWGSGPRPRWLPAAPAPPRPSVRLLNRRTEQANIVLGARSASYTDEERHAVDILTTVLGEGMSSRLFQELRERRALAYDVHSFTTRHRDSGCLAMYIGCEPRRATSAVQAATEQLRILAQTPLGDEELDRARRYVRGRLALHLEGTNALCSFLGQQELLLDRILSPAEIMARLERVTAEEVRMAAQQVLDAGLRAAVIGPFRSEERFLTALA